MSSLFEARCSIEMEAVNDRRPPPRCKRRRNVHLNILALCISRTVSQRATHSQRKPGFVSFRCQPNESINFPFCRSISSSIFKKRFFFRAKESNHSLNFIFFMFIFGKNRCRSDPITWIETHGEFIGFYSCMCYIIRVGFKVN